MKKRIATLISALIIMFSALTAYGDTYKVRTDSFRWEEIQAENKTVGYRVFIHGSKGGVANEIFNLMMFTPNRELMLGGVKAHDDLSGGGIIGAWMLGQSNSAFQKDYHALFEVDLETALKYQVTSDGGHLIVVGPVAEKLAELKWYFGSLSTSSITCLGDVTVGFQCDLNLFALEYSEDDDLDEIE